MIVYVHIPFCHRICPYCSFYKHTPGKTNQEAFIQAILDEATRSANEHQLNEVSTLYLGGGTPSMLSPSHLSKLFDGLSKALPLKNTHITLEANPATFRHDKAELFKELGVNRVSLGIQSFEGSVLKTLGREHSPEEAAESVQILQEARLDEINIDLMFSIPGQTIDHWSSTLDSAILLEPDHISAYNLTYEEDTPFFDQLRHHEDQDINADMFTLADEKLSGAGFLHYETSNYAQHGMESRHNLAYWQGDDYLGLGPSAVSTIAGNRWTNLPDTARFMSAISTIGHAKSDQEIITEQAYRTERIALLLRTTRGLPDDYLTCSPAGSVDRLISNELAEIKDGHLRLINNGPMLVDAIAAELL